MSAPVAELYRAAIVLRIAAVPTGPWSAGELLVTGEQYPHLYGGHLHPCSAEGDLYFTMSCRSGARTTCA